MFPLDKMIVINEQVQMKIEAALLLIHDVYEIMMPTDIQNYP